MYKMFVKEKFTKFVKSDLDLGMEQLMFKNWAHHNPKKRKLIKKNQE